MTEYKGMTVERGGDKYSTHRESREALVQTTLDFGPRREPELDTTLAFFDHMLEMLAWYADINIDASDLRSALRPVKRSAIGSQTASNQMASPTE